MINRVADSLSVGEHTLRHHWKDLDAWGNTNHSGAASLASDQRRHPCAMPRRVIELVKVFLAVTAPTLGVHPGNHDAFQIRQVCLHAGIKQRDRDTLAR